MSDKKTARLILEDGTQFEGYSFGAETSVSGEVVFNTAMTGYPESLTDPSYSGQILVSTYPLIGNYGVPQFTEQDGLLRFFESDRIHIRALVVSDYSFEHSHWNASESLGQWLKDNGVPGIWGVDTRRITKIIRERGVMLGKLVIEGSPEPAEFVDPNKENLAALVSTKQVETYGNGKYRIVLVDCGCKYNIVRCLTKRNATVIRVPWDYDFTQIDYDGVMLSNGPGDPQQCGATIANIRKAIALGIKDSLEIIQETGVGNDEANQLFMFTQWSEMMTEFARTGKTSTVVLPSDFSQSASMFEQMLTASKVQNDSKE